jgi:hypothetical protein
MEEHGTKVPLTDPQPEGDMLVWNVEDASMHFDRQRPRSRAARRQPVALGLSLVLFLYMVVAYVGGMIWQNML